MKLGVHQEIIPSDLVHVTIASKYPEVAVHRPRVVSLQTPSLTSDGSVAFEVDRDPTETCIMDSPRQMLVI